jgi:putative tryptophan/tyrosine transport system substrate-binding protein
MSFHSSRTAARIRRRIAYAQEAPDICARRLCTLVTDTDARHCRVLHRRRLLLAAVALTCSARVRGQAPGRLHRIGYLGYTAVNTPEDERMLAAFRQRLRELGLVEGTNLVIEWRFAEGRLNRYDEFATEFVRLGVELVIVSSGAAARAVMKASRSLSVVAIAVPDPVSSGLVASLAHPGGQVTGISNLSDDLTPKRLELLKAAVPTATRVAIARCPRCVLSAGQSAAQLSTLYKEQAAAARALGVTLVALEVNDKHDFEAVAEVLLREQPHALLINPTPVNVALQSEWVALAAVQRLPMMASYRGFGAMLSYGPDVAAIFRSAANYVARILAGARPADLAMEQPTRFEFVVNQWIAHAFGITIPKSVLLRANEVIK